MESTIIDNSFMQGEKVSFVKTLASISVLEQVLLLECVGKWKKPFAFEKKIFQQNFRGCKVGAFVRLQLNHTNLVWRLFFRRH